MGIASYVGGVARISLLESSRNRNLAAGNGAASAGKADLGTADVELRASLLVYYVDAWSQVRITHLRNTCWPWVMDT